MPPVLVQRYSIVSLYWVGLAWSFKFTNARIQQGIEKLTCHSSNYRVTIWRILPIPTEAERNALYLNFGRSCVYYVPSFTDTIPKSITRQRLKQVPQVKLWWETEMHLHLAMYPPLDQLCIVVTLFTRPIICTRFFTLCTYPRNLHIFSWRCVYILIIDTRCRDVVYTSPLFVHTLLWRLAPSFPPFTPTRKKFS